MAEELKWYVVHTYSGSEEKAKASLMDRAEKNQLTEKFGDIHVPKVSKEVVTKSGNKKTVARTSYPGYIFVQMVLDDATMHLVKNTPKITGFVGDAKNPQPLKDHEVLAMMTGESPADDEQQPELEEKFKKGDKIRVIDGPFSNFDGVVDEVKPEKAKVRVLVSIFGRETPVELEFRQIEQV